MLKNNSNTTDSINKGCTNLYTSDRLPRVVGIGVEFEPEGNDPLNERDFFKKVGKIKSILANKKYPDVIQLTYGYDIFIPMGNIGDEIKEEISEEIGEIIKNERIPLKIARVSVLNFNDPNKALGNKIYRLAVERALYTVIQKRMRAAGFFKLSGNEFIKKSALFGKEKQPIAYNIRIDVTDKGIWLYVLVVHKIIRHLKKEELEIGKEIRVLPSFKHAHITEIREEINEEEREIVISTWADKYGLETEEVLSDIYVKVVFGEGKKDYLYPRIGIVDVVDDYTRSRVMKKTEPDKERIKMLETFVENYINGKARFGPLRINLGGGIFTPIFEMCKDYTKLFDSRNLKRPEGIWHLNPQLEQVKTDWRQINTRYISEGKLVPLGGQIELKVLLVYPRNVLIRRGKDKRQMDFDKKMEDFSRWIKNEFSRYKWGNVDIQIYGSRFGLEDYKDKIDRLLEEIKNSPRFTVREVNPEDEDKERGIFLIILPTVRHTEKYYIQLKKYILDRKRIPVQFIKAETILYRDWKDILPSILSQLYIKSTNKGLWQIDCADGQCRTLYLSYDVSRVKSGERGFGGYSSVVDARGNIVMINYLNTHRESMTAENFEDIFTEIIRKARFDNIDFERIVLFKDGRVTSREVESFKRFIESGRIQYLLDGKKVKILFVSVEKSFPLRIYGVRKGFMLYYPDMFKKRVILFTADAPRGKFINPLELSVPIGCTVDGNSVKFIMNGSEEQANELDKLADEYYKLTYLSWTNLRGRNTKFTFTQVLVQLMAKDKAEDIEAPEGYMSL